MELSKDPFEIIENWMQIAKDAGIPDHNAMAMATADANSIPNVRVVLLKEIDTRGLIFYTNYESIKGQELVSNQRAAIAIHWRTLKRQIRVRGDVEVLESEKSDLYFNSRPLGSRYSAWASKQSQPLSSREQFEAEIENISQKYAQNPPRPKFWGGFRLKPFEIEFWKELDYRRHDRFRWTRVSPSSNWSVQRLYP